MQAGDQSVIRPRPEFIPTGRKYEICANFRNCRKGDACTFAHSEAEKLAWNEQLTISHNTEARPIPTKVTCRPMPKGVNCKPPRGEFMICSNFSRGSCRKEAACTFAHSEEERYQWNQQLRKELNIRNRPKISPPGGKFMQCAKFPNCSYGDRCTYAHSEEELHAWNKELAGDTTDSKPQGGEIKYEKVGDFSNNSRHKVKRIVCNETFKNLLAEHLQEKGMKLEELKEKYMDAAFKDARYDYTETEVGSSAVHEYPPEVQNIDGTPTDHVNGSDEPLVEQYEKEIEDTEGCELSLTKSSGWNVSGGLSAVYQGIGAAATMEYTTCQSETVTKFKGKRQAQRITKTISIPPKSRRSVVLARRDQRKECPAKNIKLIFPKNAKIKCKVHDNRDADPTRHTKVNPFVKDVLKDYIEDTAGGNQLTAKLEGKYVWVETSIYVDVGAAQPIDP